MELLDMLQVVAALGKAQVWGWEDWEALLG
jgi:hypothetical protein